MIKLYLDASALKKSNCRLRLLRLIRDGYRPLSDNRYKADFGTAFHLYRKMIDNGLPKDKALEVAAAKYNDPGTDALYTKGKLKMMCLMYDIEYEHDTLRTLHAKNGQACTEIKFEYPFYNGNNIEIVLFGVIDRLATDGSRKVIVDYKTTGSNRPEYFLEDFVLNPQLWLYKYITWEYSKKYPETFGDMADACAMIDGIFINSSGFTFQRSRMFDFTEKQLNCFRDDLMNFCRELDQFVKEGGQRMDGLLNGTCKGFMRCEFFKTCMIPQSSEDILNSDFYIKPYNPEMFNEED